MYFLKQFYQEKQLSVISYQGIGGKGRYREVEEVQLSEL